MSFPSSPNINDIYTEGTTSFIWDGDKWTTTPDTGANFAIGPIGATGPQGDPGASGEDGISYTGPTIEQAEFATPTYLGIEPGTLSASAYFGNVRATAESQSSWSYTRIGDKVEITGYLEFQAVSVNNAFDMGNGQLFIQFPRPAEGGPPIQNRNETGGGSVNPHPWSPVAFVNGGPTNSLSTTDGIDPAAGLWVSPLNAADTDTVIGSGTAGTSDDKLCCLVWIQDIGASGDRMSAFKAGYANVGSVLDFKITYYTNRAWAG